LDQHIFQSQTYQLHRDLTSWVASIGFQALNNSSAAVSNKSYGVTLTFTLKDLPNVRLPVNFNPGGNTATASSVNK